MHRRLALLTTLVGLALPLAGCGFRLRQPPSYGFRSLALAGFAPTSPLAAQLRRSLVEAGVQIKPSPADADVVLTALEDRRERSVAASTSAGQVRELQLRLRVRLRADTPAGRALMPTVSLDLSRDLGTTESATLAKRQEEAELYREMQADVVAQLLRRLAAITL